MNPDWTAKIVERRKLVLLLVLPLLTFLLHIHIFPRELVGIHAWRQTETGSNIIQFAERDYALTDPHVLSYEFPQGSKKMDFPIMQWTMARFYKVFGEQIWIVRGLSWLMSLFAAWGMYLLAAALFRSAWAGLIAAWAYLFSPLIFYYSVNPLPDNLALMAAIWGLAGLVLAVRRKRSVFHWAAAGALMLATAAKLPFIVFYGAPAGWILSQLLRSKGASWRRQVSDSLPYVLSVILPGIWYLSVIPTWTGNGVVKGILDLGMDGWSGVLDILWFHLISTLPELILNYAGVALFLYGSYRMFADRLRQRVLYPAFALMALGVAAYFTFEINMIGRQHDYYLLPFVPGLVLITAYGGWRMSQASAGWGSRLVLLCLLVFPLTAGLRAWPRWGLKGISEDLIAHREELRAAVPDDALVVAADDGTPHVMLYHLHKRGWALHVADTWDGQMADLVSSGAEYLYSDSRELERLEFVQPFLADTVAQHGSFIVFRLQQAENQSQ